MNTQTQTMPSGSSGSMLLGIGGIGLVVSGGVALMNLMADGGSAFGTTNDIAWGMPISTYVFFALASTGLTFVASLATVFGFKSFYPIAKRCIWLAIITLVSGMASLAMELGHPFRMLWALPFSFQFSSAMWWMGVFYTLDLLFMAAKMQKVQNGDWEGQSSKSLGIASLVSVVLATGTLGLVFGMMAMRPFWFDGLNPLNFLTAAGTTGAAFAILFTYLSNGMSQDSMSSGTKSLMTGAMPKYFAATIAVATLFVGFRTVTGLWSSYDGLDAFQVMTGSASFQFQFWVCLVAPFFLMTMQGTRNQAGMQMLAAALVVVGQFTSRFDYLVGGQIVPLFKGMWQQGFASYTPSLTEWMLTVMAISAVLLLYAVGEKMLKLGDAPNK
jgi:Ni/Fe-hydrogenase subunit HybB-like protein